jgi:hypothetical protein
VSDAVTELSRCFVGKLTGWISNEGTLALVDRDPSLAKLREARQKVMTFALVSARWTEFAAHHGDLASQRMRLWLDATEARATQRGATARAEAAAQARAWLAECAAAHARKIS